MRNISANTPRKIQRLKSTKRNVGQNIDTEDEIDSERRSSRSRSLVHQERKNVSQPLLIQAKKDNPILEDNDN